ERGTVMGRQVLVVLRVDEEMDREPAFPVGRVVVVGRDLVETELGVVIGTDPFGGIDGAALERGIDITARDLLRHDAKTRHDLSGNAGNTHLHALEIVEAVDFLAEPATHLGTGAASGNTYNAIIGQEGIVGLVAAAMIEPGILLAGIETEGKGRSDGEGGILAGEIVDTGMGDLDRIALDRV